MSPRNPPFIRLVLHLTMNNGKTSVQSLIWLGIVMALTLSISACSAFRKSIPTASAFSTSSTRSHTISPSPTLTKTPTPTRTTTRTPTHTITRSPTPSPTITRWVVTDIPFALETPTPLPTPLVGAAAYQLKAWDEQAASGLVDTAEQFSYADNIPSPFGRRRYDYQGDQYEIRLAAQEALHRFPDADFKQKLEWRIALANTIMDSSESDDWILQKIEDGLNSELIAPDSIDQMLNPYGFEIGQRQSAYNLFGNNQPAQVIWITQQDKGFTGLYAGLSQDNEERYVLTKIYSRWRFNNGYDFFRGTLDPKIQVEDHTGDGIPEVILDPGYHNGTFCGYNLTIFQWEVDRFVDVSGDQFSIDQCTLGPDTWQYGPPDANGAEPIVIYRGAGEFTGVARYERFVWNGEGYVFSESWIETPDEFDLNASAWVVYEMNEEDYQVIIEKIQQFLSDETQLQSFGPSYPDYLRFQLGLAYAFQSNEPEARSLFEQIIQTPHNPITTTVSNAAQAYLDNYYGDADLYRACQAALSVMEKASGVHPFRADAVDDDRSLKTWGYAPDWLWDSIAICNLDNAFRRIAAQLDATRFTNIPYELRKAGVLMRYAVEVDLDLDGQKEWVLMVDTPGDDAPLNLWILLNTPKGVLPLPVVEWEVKQYGLPIEDAATAGLNVRTVVTPEGISIAFLRVGEHLYTLQLNSAEMSFKNFLYSEDGVESYTVYQKDNALIVEVTVNYDNCQHCTHYHRWSGEDFEWFDPQDPDEDLVNEAISTLLKEWKPDEAAPLLRNLLDNYANLYHPYYMYLLGLAYELAGNDENAVQTYWNLWYDYPESAYARLAQYKLEMKSV